MKNVFILYIAILAFFVFAQTAFAATSNCQPIYGGGQTCVQSANLVLNKTVLNPQTNQYVDNLGMNDAKYGPDSTVTFQLTLTNNGGTNLSKVTVKDVFPQFVTFVAGAGSFEATNKTLTFAVDNLAPNESRTFTVTGKTSNEAGLPANTNVVCVVNQATATAEDKSSSDNAQFCIAKQVQPTVAPTTKGGLKVLPPTQAKTTPPTGPEAFALIGLFPAGAFGYFLRKKASL